MSDFWVYLISYRASSAIIQASPNARKLQGALACLPYSYSALLSNYNFWKSWYQEYAVDYSEDQSLFLCFWGRVLTLVLGTEWITWKLWCVFLWGLLARC